MAHPPDREITTAEAVSIPKRVSEVLWRYLAPLDYYGIVSIPKRVSEVLWLQH